MTVIPTAKAAGRATSRTVREQHAKMFDPLTGLPGWPLLIDRTHIALERAASHGFLVGVVVLDDVRRAGSASPDLTKFISLLRDAFCSDDTVARIEGCTFVIVINDVSDRDAVIATVQAVVASSRIACRVGVAFGASPRHAAELIDEALQDAAPPPPPPQSEAPAWWQGFGGPDSDALAPAG
jgi:GGDEF domain-containing protein